MTSAPSASGGLPRRIDPATSMLDEITTSALDPAYAEAHRKRSAGGAPTGRPARSVGLIAAVLALGLLLATAALQTQRSAPERSQQRAALSERIRQGTKDNDEALKQIDALRAEITAEQTAQLRVTGEGRAVADQLAALMRATGEGAISGRGLRVVVNDAPQSGQASTSRGGQFATNRVFDTDLQKLVNGLWAAGAQAVAINGQRLGPTSAIRSAGDAILVAYHPVAPPYVVEAIGDPKQ